MVIKAVIITTIFTKVNYFYIVVFTEGQYIWNSGHSSGLIRYIGNKLLLCL